MNKKKKPLLESNSKGTIFSYRLGGMGEGEGEFLRSHGFRSEGDYRKLTAIRGGDRDNITEPWVGREGGKTVHFIVTQPKFSTPLPPAEKS